MVICTFAIATGETSAPAGDLSEIPDSPCDTDIGTLTVILLGKCYDGILYMQTMILPGHLAERQVPMFLIH